MKNEAVQLFWEEFSKANPSYKNHTFNYGYFCDNEADANTCAELVKNDIKRATAHALLSLQLNNTPLPKIGDLFVVTDWPGTPKCIVKTTSVKLLPYFTINAEHARLEGEGDKSLEHWQRNHWAYYTRELKPFNRYPSQSMIVVFERFEKIY